MKYMLDTNICIYIIKQKPIEVIQKLRTLNVSDVCISSITLSELEYGVSKSAHPLKNKIVQRIKYNKGKSLQQILTSIYKHSSKTNLISNRGFYSRQKKNQR